MLESGELSKEMEPKQRTPSVIARLMGLDEMPPQQPVHKQQRVLSENYLRKTASIGLRERQSCYEGGSFRRNVEKSQEYKDVFEVPEIPKMYYKHRIQSVPKGRTNSSMTEAKLACIKQKLTNAKCLSMDEKFQHLKEFDDVLEELDSNNDLLLRYFWQSDSLFTKHIHDLQGVQLHSQSGEIAVLKSSDSPNCRKNEICRKSERTTARGNDMKLFSKPENGSITGSSGEFGIDYSHKLLKSRLELKDETCLPPTRIVLLKPNFEKVQNVARSSFLRTSQECSKSGDRKIKEFPKPKNEVLYNEVRERKNLANDLEPSRHSFRLSREFTKGITRQKRHSVGSSSTEVSRSEFRVDHTFVNESEVLMPSFPSSFNRKNRHQTSYSSSNGSSLAREAKKQLSERWKMTKCFQEVEVAGRGNTLGEMLAMPVQETRPGNLNYKIDKHGLYNQLSLNYGDANLGSPLCISSRNGWKDEHVRNLPRSRALPAASLANGNSKSRIKNEALHSDWCLMLQEAVTLDKNELRKQNFSQRVSSNASGSKFICVKSLSFPCLDSENNHTIQENCVIQDEQENKLLGEDLSEVNSVVSKLSSHRVPCSNLEYNHTVQGTRVIQDELVNNFEEKDLSENFEQKSMVTDLSISGVASASVTADVVATAVTEDVELSSGTHVEQQQCELAAYILSERDGNPSYVLDASIGQESSIRSHEGPEPPSNCPGTDPELSIYFGEGYSPSPNSVLEPTFADEILSVPECFKSVNSDLHGLRMKLQLLKSESEDLNSEGPGMVVSSDEDSGDGSVDLSEENIKLLGLFSAEESRDFSYLIDVLDEAGYHGRNLEMGFETWNSSKCPVSPSVFETLEKKYGEQTSWQKSERRLLFDRINSGLMEIVQPCMHMHMWEKPLRKRFNLSQSREVIEEELWMLLVSQEQEVSKDLAEKAVGRDLRWLELGDDIEVIGREIQRFLFDELVAELASTKIF